jgi:hypothetical protein
MFVPRLAVFRVAVTVDVGLVGLEETVIVVCVYWVVLLSSVEIVTEGRPWLFWEEGPAVWAVCDEVVR